MKFLSEHKDLRQKLNLVGFGQVVHEFEPEDIHAINAALAGRRPLLLKGEPGMGKSQLARAAAKALNWPFVKFVADSRTESRDLLWSFDAVKRLADAQVLAQAKGMDSKKLQKKIVEDKYIQPGPLWWGLNWETAKEKNDDRLPEQCWVGEHQDQVSGCVVLIDEVDKAEPDVPNGLLEVLGDHQFTLPVGKRDCISLRLDDEGKELQHPPLVVITTNNEQSLPPAFVRRCFVHHLELPDSPQLESVLIKRGKAHFSSRLGHESDVYGQAAALVATERQHCQSRNQFPLPGVAECIDLLRAYCNLVDQGNGEEDSIKEILSKIAPYAVSKHRNQNRSIGPGNDTLA